MTSSRSITRVLLLASAVPPTVFLFVDAPMWAAWALAFQSVFTVGIVTGLWLGYRS